MNDVNPLCATRDIRDRNDRERRRHNMIQAVRDLYLVSSAAAQLGCSGLEVTRSQWQGLLENTRRSRAAINQGDDAGESGKLHALCELVLACEEILEKRSPDGSCPPALWRRASRMGREAYECIEVSIAKVRDKDEGLP